MSFPRAFLLLVALTCLVGSASAEVVWHPDLATARQRASQSGRRILLFFSLPGSTLSEHHARQLADPGIQKALETSYEAVRLDYQVHRETALALNAFRAGTINLYSSDGTALGQIHTELTLEEFTGKVAAATGTDSIRPTGGASPPPGAGGNGLPKASTTPALPLLKGDLISGPFDVHLRSTDTLPFGRLDAGKSYILTLSGRGSIWNGKTDGIDPLYIFRSDLKKSGIQNSKLVRVGPDRTPLHAHLKAVGATIPEYNAEHSYDILLQGTGEPFQLCLYDSGGSHDNLGSFRIALYEAAGY